MFLHSRRYILIIWYICVLVLLDAQGAGFENFSRRVSLAKYIHRGRVVGRLCSSKRGDVADVSPWIRGVLLDGLEIR